MTRSKGKRGVDLQEQIKRDRRRRIEGDGDSQRREDEPLSGVNLSQSDQRGRRRTNPLSEWTRG